MSQNQKQAPQTVSQMYPSPWLKAADLAKPVTVTIESARPELIFNPRDNEHHWRTVVTFYKCQKKLILNKTQSYALATITGTERFDQWQGHQVTVAPGLTRSKQPTIVITPAQDRPAPSAPPMTESAAIQGMMTEDDADPETWIRETDAAYS